MATSTLEQIRTLHEEMDAIEQVMVVELGEKKKGQRDTVLQNHKIAVGLDSCQTRARDLLRLYEDQSNQLEQEKKEMMGKSALDAFNSKLKGIKKYYHRNPDTLDQARAEEVAQNILSAVEVEFSGEEEYGKHFDLHQRHMAFVNLSNLPESITGNLSYTKYLTRISVFHDIPHKLKTTRYENYLSSLRDYLVDFRHRARVLDKLDMASCHADFEAAWAARTVPGWTDVEENTGSKAVLEQAGAIDLDAIADVKQLEQLSGDVLKVALSARGLRCGGTVQQRAERLFAVKGLNKDQYPRKLLAKPPKKKKQPATTPKGDAAGDGKSNNGDGQANNGDGQANNGDDGNQPADTGTPFGALARWKRIARTEREIQVLVEDMMNVLDATKEYVTKKLTRSFEELQAEREEDEVLGEVVEDHLVEDEGDEPVIHNPLNVPLGHDGKPMDFWLFKLQGLDKEFKCEICGNYSYWGRRSFDQHFQQARHARGMRVLGIPNTKHFHDITKIDEAKALHQKLKYKLEKSEFKAMTEEQFEDSEGNVLSKRVYEDLKRQNML